MVHSISDVQSILPPIFDCHGIAKTALLSPSTNHFVPVKYFCGVVEELSMGAYTYGLCSAGLI